MLPALDVMKEYLGIIFAFPDVVTIHRGAVSKITECSKMKEEGRIDVSLFSGVWLGKKRRVFLFCFLAWDLLK